MSRQKGWTRQVNRPRCQSSYIFSCFAWANNILYYDIQNWNYFTYISISKRKWALTSSPFIPSNGHLVCLWQNVKYVTWSFKWLPNFTIPLLCMPYYSIIERVHTCCHVTMFIVFVSLNPSHKWNENNGMTLCERKTKPYLWNISKQKHIYEILLM